MFKGRMGKGKACQRRWRRELWGRGSRKASYIAKAGQGGKEEGA